MKQTFSIEWHKECLKNQKAYLSREKDSLAIILDRISRLEKGIEIYELQIATAEQQGKGVFDPDRFMVKRK